MPELTPEQQTQLTTNIQKILDKGGSQADVQSYAQQYRDILKKNGSQQSTTTTTPPSNTTAPPVSDASQNGSTPSQTNSITDTGDKKVQGLGGVYTQEKPFNSDEEYKSNQKYSYGKQPYGNDNPTHPSLLNIPIGTKYVPKNPSSANRPAVWDGKNWIMDVKVSVDGKTEPRPITNQKWIDNTSERLVYQLKNPEKYPESEFQIPSKGNSITDNVGVVGAINKVNDYAKSLQQQPTVTPQENVTPENNGGVQMDWNRPNPNINSQGNVSPQNDYTAITPEQQKQNDYNKHNEEVVAKNKITATQNQFVNQLNNTDSYVKGAKLLQENPNDTNGMFLVGSGFRDVGNEESAKKMFGQILSINPNDEKAKQALFDLSPESGHDAYKQGVEIQQQGGLGSDIKAAQFYQQALQINPNNYKAKFALGGLSAKNNDYSSAINLYTSALQSMPEKITLGDTEYTNPDYKTALGQIALNQSWLSTTKTGEEKTALLNQANTITDGLLKDNPDDVLANQNKAYIEKQNGNDKEANQYLTKAVESEVASQPAPMLYKMATDFEKTHEGLNEGQYKMLYHPMKEFGDEWQAAHEDITKQLGGQLSQWGMRDVDAKALSNLVVGAVDIPQYLGERVGDVGSGLKEMKDGYMAMGDGTFTDKLSATAKMLTGGSKVAFSTMMLVNPVEGYTFINGINSADVLTNGAVSKIVMSPLQSFTPQTDSKVWEATKPLIDTAWSLLAFMGLHGAKEGIKTSEIKSAADKLMNGESLTGAETKLLYEYTKTEATPENLQKIYDTIKSIPSDTKKSDILPLAKQLLAIKPETLKGMPEGLTALQQIKIAPLLEYRDTQAKVLESIKEPFKEKVKEKINGVDEQIKNIVESDLPYKKFEVGESVNLGNGKTGIIKTVDEKNGRMLIAPQEVSGVDANGKPTFDEGKHTWYEIPKDNKIESKVEKQPENKNTESGLTDEQQTAKDRFETWIENDAKSNDEYGNTHFADKLRNNPIEALNELIALKKKGLEDSGINELTKKHHTESIAQYEALKQDYETFNKTKTEDVPTQPSEKVQPEVEQPKAKTENAAEEKQQEDEISLNKLKKEIDAQKIQDTRINSLGFNESTLSKSETQELQSLRGERDSYLQRMDKQRTAIYDRYGGETNPSTFSRQDRQRWELLQGELQMGNNEGTGMESKRSSQNILSGETGNIRGLDENIGNKQEHDKMAIENGKNVNRGSNKSSNLLPNLTPDEQDELTALKELQKNGDLDAEDEAKLNELEARLPKTDKPQSDNQQPALEDNAIPIEASRNLTPEEIESKTKNAQKHIDKLKEIESFGDTFLDALDGVQSKQKELNKTTLDKARKLAGEKGVSLIDLTEDDYRSIPEYLEAKRLNGLIDIINQREGKDAFDEKVSDETAFWINEQKNIPTSKKRITTAPKPKPTEDNAIPIEVSVGVVGDVKNKAVDKSGEPIEMYHGSGTSKDFEDFNDNSFFTPNDYIAENYAENQGGKVHKRYIYTKNPFEVSEDASRMSRSNSGMLIAGTDSNIINLLSKLYGKDAVDTYKQYGLTKGLGNIVQGDFEPLIKYAKENGHDSIKFKDVSFDHLMTDDTYLVFDTKNVSKDKNVIKSKSEPTEQSLKETTKPTEDKLVENIPAKEDLKNMSEDEFYSLYPTDAARDLAKSLKHYEHRLDLPNEELPVNPNAKGLEEKKQKEIQKKADEENDLAKRKVDAEKSSALKLQSEYVTSKRKDIVELEKQTHKDYVQKAIDNGNYKKWIADGETTPEKVKSIIESTGLEVPKDISAPKEAPKEEVNKNLAQSQVQVSRKVISPSNVGQQPLSADTSGSNKEAPKEEVVKEEKPIEPKSDNKEWDKKYTDIKVINEGRKFLKEKIGEKKTDKYFQQVNKLINPNENNIVEYRQFGVVTKEGDKYIFNAIGDQDLKTWRISKGFTQDVTDQFAPKTESKTETVTPKSETVTGSEKVEGKTGEEKVKTFIEKVKSKLDKAEASLDKKISENKGQANDVGTLIAQKLLKSAIKTFRAEIEGLEKAKLTADEWKKEIKKIYDKIVETFKGKLPKYDLSKEQLKFFDEGLQGIHDEMSGAVEEQPTEEVPSQKVNEEPSDVGISIAKLKDQYNFSKEFTSRGGGEVATGVLTELNNTAKEKGIPLNQVIANEVSAMQLQGSKLAPTEHNIITAGAHLLNLDKKIKEAESNGEDTKLLVEQRDNAASVLRQLGNNTGRNLGLFNLVFKDVNDSEISVVRNKLGKELGITNVPESKAELDKQLENKEITKSDYDKALPYVNKIEQAKSDLAKYEKESVKNISKLNDDEVQQAIKKAHEQGKQEGNILLQGKKEKKSKQLRNLADKLRSSDVMDNLLKGDEPKQSAIVDFTHYKQTIANILDGIADVVEAGEDIKDYLKKAIDKVTDFDKKKLRDDIDMMITKSQLPSKDEVIKNIKKIAKNEKSATITKSMVEKGLIKNIVDDAITSDVPYEKVIETATDELKQYLPNVTKEDVADAFVRRNEFKKDNKVNLENIVKTKTEDVKRLANKDAKFNALEAGEEYNAADTKEKKQQVRSDYENELDKKIKDLTDSKKEVKELQTDKSPLEKAKESVQKKIDAIRKEIAEKERVAKEERAPFHEDVELGRLKEVEKALTTLRDKYLPEAPEKFVDEKTLKQRRVNLNKEISDLNDQINKGKRNEKGVKIPDTEHIKTLRKIKEAKQELLDQVAPDFEKIKKQQEKAAQLQKQKLADIDKEIQSVKDSKKVFEQAIKNPKEANELLKAARAERDKTYSDNGLRVQKNSKQPIRIEREYQKAVDKIESNEDLTKEEKADKIAELKQQRDLDLQGTKQGVISHLHDDITNLQNDLTNKANDAEEGSKEFEQINKLNTKLQGIKSDLAPTGENLEDIANKAYEKINGLLEDKNITTEQRSALEKIKKDFENNNQKTADELAQQTIKKQWEQDIKTAQTKINSKTFTELPVTPFDFRRSTELSNLDRQRQNTTKKLNNLVVEAREKNKLVADKVMDLSTKLLISGVHTVARVGEAALFKPIADSIVDSTAGRLVNKLTDTPRTTFATIKKGFSTLGAFKDKASAEAHIKKLETNKLNALEKLQSAIENGDTKEISNAKKEFQKADLQYGISTLYHSIDANSLKTFWEYLAHGATDLDEQIGKGLKKNISDYRTNLEKTGYVIDGWIRTHAALKTSISARNEIMRSYASTLEWMQKNGKELNHENLALAHLIAVNDFEYGRLTNKTWFSKVISKGKESKNPLVRVGTKVVAPVSTIAINIAKRGVDYSSVGGEGLYRLYKGAKEGMRINEVEGKEYDTLFKKIAAGINEIPIQERKYINGVISRGMFGAALGAITLYGLSTGNVKYGGTWDDRNKRKVMGSDGNQLMPNEWEFFGWKAPKLFDSFINHVPEMLPIALTADAYQIHTLDKTNELDPQTGMYEHGGDAFDYFQTTMGEIENRLPFQTLLGLAQGKFGQTLTDRFTRVPLAQEIESTLDSKERENKTLGEKIKNNTGLGFLNPSKGGFSETDLKDPTNKFLNDNQLSAPTLDENEVRNNYAVGKKTKMTDQQFKDYSTAYNNQFKTKWDAIVKAKNVSINSAGNVTIESKQLKKPLNQLTSEELKKLMTAIKESSTSAAQKVLK